MPEILPARHSPHDREILRLALPALGALAAEPLYVLVDTAIVGHLGRPQILRDRVARWPLVNLVHTLFTPVMSIWRANLSPSGSLRLGSSDALVESYLQQDGRPVSQHANLHRSAR